jgi:hypothetical protein
LEKTIEAKKTLLFLKLIKYYITIWNIVLLCDLI